MKIGEIKTPRLFLRGFAKEDARFAMSIWNDPEMGEYLTDPSNENVDDEYLKELEDLGDDDECCYLIAELQTTGERIGTCSFIPGEDNKAFDIAYCVHKKYWMQGYATEMAQGMIHYAKAQGGQKITARINKENEASNRIARKLGFTVIGEKSYKKCGTNFLYVDYLYELII